MSRRHKLPCGNCCTDPCTIQIVGGPFVDMTGLTQIGTVTVSSGQAVLESGEGFVFTVEPTNATDPVILTAVAQTSGSTATLRLMVAAVDEDNGLYGEVRIDSGALVLEVGSRDAGTNTPFVDPMPVDDESQLGDSTTISLCWVPGDEVVEGGEEHVACAATYYEAEAPWDVETRVITHSVNTDAPPLIAAVFPCLVIPPGSTIDQIGVVCDGLVDMPSEVFLKTIQLFTLNPSGLTGDVKTANIDVGNASPWTGQGLAGDLAYWGLEDLTTASAPALYAEIIFRGGSDAGGTQMTITKVEIGIDFTTPDRRPGRLTLSRNNVTVMSVDCARSLSAYAPGTGKKAAVVSAAGTWLVTSAAYQYHESAAKPTCPNCSCPVIPCLQCSGTLNDYGMLLLDLGAGGLTNGLCTTEGNDCTDLAGEVVLFPATASACFWFGGWPYAAIGACATRINAYVEENDDGRFFVAAIAWPSGYAFYRYELGDDDECELPITLTKVSQVNDTGLGTYCSGSLPTTITVDVFS